MAHTCGNRLGTHRCAAPPAKTTSDTQIRQGVQCMLTWDFLFAPPLPGIE